MWLKFTRSNMSKEICVHSTMLHRTQNSMKHSKLHESLTYTHMKELACLHFQVLVVVGTWVSNSKKPETLSFFHSFFHSFFLSFLSNFPEL